MPVNLKHPILKRTKIAFTPHHAEGGKIIREEKEVRPSDLVVLEKIQKHNIEEGDLLVFKTKKGPGRPSKTLFGYVLETEAGKIFVPSHYTTKYDNHKSLNHYDRDKSELPFIDLKGDLSKSEFELVGKAHVAVHKGEGEEKKWMLTDKVAIIPRATVSNIAKAA